MACYSPALTAAGVFVVGGRPRPSRLRRDWRIGRYASHKKFYNVEENVNIDQITPFILTRRRMPVRMWRFKKRRKSKWNQEI